MTEKCTQADCWAWSPGMANKCGILSKVYPAACPFWKSREQAAEERLERTRERRCEHGR